MSTDMNNTMDSYAQQGGSCMCAECVMYYAKQHAMMGHHGAMAHHGGYPGMGPMGGMHPSMMYNPAAAFAAFGGLGGLGGMGGMGGMGFNPMAYSNSAAASAGQFQPILQPPPRDAPSNATPPPMNDNSSADPDAVNPVTYNLLEQFRQTIGVLVGAACSPRGRSMLQAVMRLQHLDKIHMIFSELVAQVDVVMLDPNGCHVMRALIELLDESQINTLVSCMSEQLILNLATLSQYTRRILQVMFERHNKCNLQMIVSILGKNARYLAATQQGCIALMRVFEQCTPEQKAEMLTTLLPVLAELATDPFGNYVVQCILENSDRAQAAGYVVNAFGGKLVKLCCNKFASNVMEKVVKQSTPQVRRILIEELVINPTNMQTLIADGFGNFVVQALIDSCTNQAEFKKLSEKLRPQLHTSPYGHKIEGKIRNKRFNSNGHVQPSGPKRNALAPHNENVARGNVGGFQKRTMGSAVENFERQHMMMDDMMSMDSAIVEAVHSR